MNIDDGKGFSVYNLLGDKVFGAYEDASTVQDDTLAVKKNGKCMVSPGAKEWQLLSLNIWEK